MIVGNLPDSLNYNYGHGIFEPFTGCMRDIFTNGKLLDFSEPLAQEGVVGGCRSRCDPSPCKNGGTCSETWTSFVCNCASHFSGPTCTVGESIAEPRSLAMHLLTCSPSVPVSPSISFTGEGFIQYEVNTATSSMSRMLRQDSLYVTGRNLISLGFVTSGDSGTILQLGYKDDSDYAILEVSNAKSM